MGKTFEDFHCGSDSGFAALQLAVILGYERIYLLGFDFCTSGTITHYHDDYKSFPPSEDYQKKLDEFMISYPLALQELRERGIQVISSSPISKLNEYILYQDVRATL
jgi:hypothetical protein